MNPTVSVLTPVYNGERYLAECIDSVLAQTRTDWEYVIVDNCSTDQSAAIAESYAARDSRIRAIRCTDFVNAHLSFSRTVDYMHPGTRYCKFIAADDLLYPTCLERMVAIAEKYPSAGFISAYRMEGKHLDASKLLPPDKDFMTGHEAIRKAILEDLYATGSPTTLLFTAEVARSRRPFLDDRVWHSDTDAALRALLNSDLGFVHEALSYTRVHSDSLTVHMGNPLNTPATLHVEAIIRFGTQVLTKEEYRRAMRTRLGQYWWFLFKAMLKPVRRKDQNFQSFHDTQIRLMLAELPEHDGESRLVLRSMLALLSRPSSFATPYVGSN
jgi:glycosyltransferase involved in cell wall biosynthesis